MLNIKTDQQTNTQRSDKCDLNASPSSPSLTEGWKATTISETKQAARVIILYDETHPRLLNAHIPYTKSRQCPVGPALQPPFFAPFRHCVYFQESYLC